MTVEMQARRAKRNRPSNRDAERITGRDYISHTQLGVMRACPRKFAYPLR